MAGSRGINGIALASVAAGFLFAYAGIRGISVPHALQSMLTGKPPGAGGQDQPINTATVAGDSGTAAAGTTDSAIANDFLRYVGHAYTFGGAPGTDGRHPWDCSSACNWVIGHDIQLPIPGEKAGAYTGASHGPNTVIWLTWAASGHLDHVRRSDVQAGDLVIYQTHMGVATSNTEYISAQDPKDKTRVSPIGKTGPNGEPGTYWRYPAIQTSGGQPRTGTHPRA